MEAARKDIEDAAPVTAALVQTARRVVKDHSYLLAQNAADWDAQRERNRETDARIKTLVSAMGAFFSKQQASKQQACEQR